MPLWGFAVSLFAPQGREPAVGAAGLCCRVSSPGFVPGSWQSCMFPHAISQPVSPLCSLPGDTGSSPIPGMCPTRRDSLSTLLVSPWNVSDKKLSPQWVAADVPRPVTPHRAASALCPAHTRAGAASCTLGGKEVSMAANTTGRLCKKLDFFFFSLTENASIFDKRPF